MNILERRRDSLLTQFYCALEATDQHDLVQLIRYKGLTMTYCHWRWCQQELFHLIVFAFFIIIARNILMNFIVLDAYDMISQTVGFYLSDATLARH